MLRRSIVAVAASAMFALGLAGPAVAGQGNPNGTGQPSQSCGSATAPNTPGQSSSAPGSAFNPAGHAGTVYAGQQPQNSRNVHSVSQYDVACFQTSSH
jgi:hypothetical protein